MQTLIEERLREELKYRSTRLLSGHIGLLLMTWVMLKDLPHFYPFFLILTALLVRPFVFSRKVLFHLCVVLSGLGWSWLSYLSATHLGLYSTESLFCLACILIIMSGGVSVFSVSLLTADLFLLSVTVGPLYVLFKDEGPSSYKLGVLLGLHLLYQFYHSYITHQLDIKSIKDELKVKKQNQFLQQFIDSIPGLVTVIRNDRHFLMVNNYLEGRFREYVGRSLSDFYPTSEMAKVLENFLTNGKASETHEVQFDEFGEKNWYVMNLSRMSNPEEGIIAAILPITDLVKAKNDLKIHEARSQYAEKLASLGEVSAGIAHEVNNPLTIIEGSANFLKVLLDEAEMDREAMRKATLKISNTTHRIARIIKSLRTLAVNADEDPFKNVSFSAIMEPCLEIVKAKLDAHAITLKVQAPQVDVQLFGNEIQLSQVVMNLITNAIDAVKDCPEPRWIEVHYRPALEWLDILIIDNGPGVSPENREKIMEAFFTTKGTGHGTGLGLSISKAIVEAHHGSLVLMSAEKHTTFRMRFPRMTVWQS